MIIGSILELKSSLVLDGIANDKLSNHFETLAEALLNRFVIRKGYKKYHIRTDVFPTKTAISTTAHN